MKLPGGPAPSRGYGSGSIVRYQGTMQGGPAMVQPAIRSTQDWSGYYREIESSKAGIWGDFGKLAVQAATAYKDIRDADALFQSKQAVIDYTKQKSAWIVDRKAKAGQINPDTGKPYFETYLEDSHAFSEQLKGEIRDKYTFESTESNQYWSLQTAEREATFMEDLLVDSSKQHAARASANWDAGIEALETQQDVIKHVDDGVRLGLIFEEQREEKIAVLSEAVFAKSQTRRLHDPSTPFEEIKASRQDAMTRSGAWEGISEDTTTKYLTASLAKIKGEWNQTMFDAVGKNLNIAEGKKILGLFAHTEPSELGLTGEEHRAVFSQLDSLLNKLKPEVAKEDNARGYGVLLELLTRASVAQEGPAADPVNFGLRSQLEKKEINNLEEGLSQNLGKFYPSEYFHADNAATAPERTAMLALARAGISSDALNDYAEVYITGRDPKERQVMLEYMTQIQSLNPLTFNQYSETVKNGVEAYRVLKEYGLTNDPEFENMFKMLLHPNVQLTTDQRAAHKLGIQEYVQDGIDADINTLYDEMAAKSTDGLGRDKVQPLSGVLRAEVKTAFDTFYPTFAALAEKSQMDPELAKSIALTKAFDTIKADLSFEAIFTDVPGEWLVEGGVGVPMFGSREWKPTKYGPLSDPNLKGIDHGWAREQAHSEVAKLNAAREQDDLPTFEIEEIRQVRDPNTPGRYVLYTANGQRIMVNQRDENGELVIGNDGNPKTGAWSIQYLADDPVQSQQKAYERLEENAAMANEEVSQILLEFPANILPPINRQGIPDVRIVEDGEGGFRKEDMETVKKAEEKKVYEHNRVAVIQAIKRSLENSNSTLSDREIGAKADFYLYSEGYKNWGADGEELLPGRTTILIDEARG